MAVTSSSWKSSCVNHGAESSKLFIDLVQTDFVIGQFSGITRKGNYSWVYIEKLEMDFHQNDQEIIESC